MRDKIKIEGSNNVTIEMERCSKCILPVTWESIFYDENGVCNICNNWSTQKAKIDWDERSARLQEICEKAKEEAKRRNNKYHCIVPFSGGKDTSYILWYTVTQLKMRPLVVTFDHGFFRPRMLENRMRTFRKLGVDVLTFLYNWQLQRKIMLEALKRKGDFCWHCHLGVTVFPMQEAIRRNIPLIIWGEGGGEYEGYFKYQMLEQMREWKFNRRCTIGMRAEDMSGFVGVDPEELEPFIYPSEEEMNRVGLQSLPLGNFIPWDVQKHVAVIKKELGWQEDVIESGYPWPSYEKIECQFTGIRDYVKFLKRGFSRMTHLCTLDIRHGRMTREEALGLIAKHEGKKPKSLKVMLEYLGISEEEFHEICAWHLIQPAPVIKPHDLPEGEELWDQGLWLKESGD